uniref:Uncharacterized protein n=1 Tax=Photinus pyralis TaxID=7054 RepID=A0A1Y1M9J8_PHOPY
MLLPPWHQPHFSLLSCLFCILGVISIFVANILLIKMTHYSEAKQRNPINFSPCDSESNSPKLTFSPVTHLIEKGQGDGPHNNCPESPRKKFKADNGDQITDKPELKYISSNGHIEFHRRSSKKLQAETKWNRPCKLEVAYSATNFEDCVIYMMIYQGNLKCRRNLMKDFDACDPGSE